jgi:hypothetical protein
MPHEKGHGSSGSGDPPPTEDDPHFPGSGLFTQGLVTLAFGLALGAAFMLLFWFVRAFGAPTGKVADFVAEIHPNLWFSFLAGFVGGTLLSAIYNLLVQRRINLFGSATRLN